MYVEVTDPEDLLTLDFDALPQPEGLWGPENLSLIPGEVGASAVQNIGAYGVEAKDIIDTVHAFDRQERRFVDIPGADCGYGYRTSLFKTAWKGRYIITAVTFRLSTVPQPKRPQGARRPRACPAGHPGYHHRHPGAEAAGPEGDRERGELLLQPGHRPGALRAHCRYREGGERPGI